MILAFIVSKNKMEIKWKEIWEKRSADENVLKENNQKEVFLELKRSNGFDVLNDGLSYEALEKQYIQTKQELCDRLEIDSKEELSIYEVGSGSGANLYLFESDGYRTGGIDYSQHLINSSKIVLKSEDIVCNEAINMPIENKYDFVLSNSVFSYFPDEEYANAVLEKMYDKAKYSIGLIDIHDADKRDQFIAFRKQTIEDYEERYKNLPKYFYSKSFFEDFANKHNMRIKFTDSEVDGYWNNDYVFNCFMYKL